ncbi:MAG: TraX family protein [Pseudoxanthomonas sp.]|nr:TraX family protein [Pseudoxanthomonas sp.]
MKSKPLPVASDVVISSAGREWLKWLALVLMTGDHANKVLNLGMPILGDISRVVFPIFAIVLAYNMREVSPASRRQSMVRLLCAAVIAQPFHVLCFGDPLTLNVLFTLLLGVFVVYSGTPMLSLVAVLTAGWFVDYGPMGVAVVVTASMLFHGGLHVRLLLALAASVALLYLVNGNWYALAALPLLAVLGRVPGAFPRWRWTFLAYYVGHLALLAAIA